MERAYAHKIGACALERDIAADDLFDIASCNDFLNNLTRNSRNHICTSPHILT